jgi:hypothetical protein
MTHRERAEKSVESAITAIMERMGMDMEVDANDHPKEHAADCAFIREQIEACASQAVSPEAASKISQASSDIGFATGVLDGLLNHLTLTGSARAAVGQAIERLRALDVVALARGPAATKGPYKPHWPFDSYPKDEATWQKAVQVYESLLAQVDELKAAHAPAVSEEKCRHDRAEELEAVLWNIANPPKGCAPDWGQKIAKAVLSEKARPATSGGEDGK